MAKAKKLPSGSWRVLVYAGTDPSGKRKYDSITAPTKKEAEYLAAEHAMNQKRRKSTSEITIKEAITRYIDSKDGVLSPSTIRGYRSIQHRDLPFGDVALKDLTNETIQQGITAISQERAPKTVANICGLLTAALGMFYPDFRVVVSLPKRIPRPSTVPVETQIKSLLKLAKGADIELPIMLAALGSLRESEIAALAVGDIASQGIRVNKAMVRDQNHKWVIKKTPKTDAGARLAPLPKQVITLLRKQAQGKGKEDRLFDLTPQNIYRKFSRIRQQCGMEECRFHDLRHYYASLAHALGVPDQYIMKNGGWKDKDTLTRIYQHTLSDYAEQENKKITDHFSALLKSK